jgi:hypothetical protein
VLLSRASFAAGSNSMVQRLDVGFRDVRSPETDGTSFNSFSVSESKEAEDCLVGILPILLMRHG